jgi:hypothetical protein
MARLRSIGNHGGIFSTIMTLRIKRRDPAFVWQKGVIKW